MAVVVMHLMLAHQETRYCHEKDIRPFDRLPNSSNTLNCPALSGPETDDTADTPSIVLKQSTMSCATPGSSRREPNSLLLVPGGGLIVIDIFVLATSLLCAPGIPCFTGWVGSRYESAAERHVGETSDAALCCKSVEGFCGTPAVSRVGSIEAILRCTGGWLDGC